MMLPKSIKAVLFDVDGTLYAQPLLRLLMSGEIVASAALEPRQRPRIRAVRAFRKLRETLRDEHDVHEPVSFRQYRVVSGHLHCATEDVQSAVHEWIHERPLKWLRYCRRRGLVELLRFLRSRGIDCGVFSDYRSESKLTALGVRGEFGLVLSAEDPDILALKPHPRGFAIAALRWNLRPSQVLYVGDRPEVDGAGAAAAGMPCAILGRRRDPVRDNGVFGVRDLKELQRVLSRVV